MHVPSLKFIDVLVFEILYHKLNCRIRGPFARQPSLLWQPFAPHSLGGHPHVGFQEWSLCDHP